MCSRRRFYSLIEANCLSLPGSCEVANRSKPVLRLSGEAVVVGEVLFQALLRVHFGVADVEPVEGFGVKEVNVGHAGYLK